MCRAALESEQVAIDENELMRLDLIWCAVTFEALANTLQHHSITHYQWCESLAREAHERLRKWTQAKKD
jgi:hypothetical protein